MSVRVEIGEVRVTRRFADDIVASLLGTRRASSSASAARFRVRRHAARRPGRDRGRDGCERDGRTRRGRDGKKGAGDRRLDADAVASRPLDGTSSTETDGVHAVKVVQNTWWEALTMTPVYAFRATRAKWASAPAVAAAIDPGFDADVFSRLAAVGRDEVLRAYAAHT